MAWIELHQTLPTNKKTIRLKNLLRIKVPQAVGHLCILWLWALDNAPDGDLSGFTSGEIAEFSLWASKSSDEFVDALKQAGFIDEDMRLHHWHDYAGKLVDKRKQNAERMRKARASNVQCTNDERTGATVPYHINNILSSSNDQKGNDHEVLAINGENPLDECEKQKKNDALIGEIIKYLNQKAESSFRSTTATTRKLINGRISDGYGLEAFQRVIDDRCRLWKGSSMEQYLRPSTLFSPKNFENYINALPKQADKEYFRSEFDVFGEDNR